MRLQLQKRSPEGNPEDWVAVKLQYPRPNMVRVMANGKTVEPLSLLDNNA